MFLSGFADEAGTDIDTQIRAQTEIGGYGFLEPRMVGTTQFTQLSDSEFEAVWEKIQAAGLGISCYGSAIANWSRNIDADFSPDIEDLERSAPRMRKTGTKFIRVMSWSNKNKVPDETWRDEAIKRMRRLASIAEDNDIILGHENCDGWAGLSPENTIRFVESVDSPAFKLIFDTGNSTSHGLDSWDFYSKVREHIAYVHIKDSKNQNGKVEYTFPDEGDGAVKRILTDLFKTGYDGGFSIEPHIAGAIHNGTFAGEQWDAYAIYVEYGRRTKALIDQCKADASS